MGRLPATIIGSEDQNKKLAHITVSQIHSHVLMIDKSKTILNLNLPKVCFVYSYFVTKIKQNTVPEQFSSIESEME